MFDSIAARGGGTDAQTNALTASLLPATLVLMVLASPSVPNEVTTTLVNQGMLGFVIHALMRTDSVPELTACCAVLSRVASQGALLPNLLECHALEALYEVMRSHGAVVSIQEHGCNVLMCMSKHAGCKRALLATPTAKGLLMRARTQHPHAEAIQRITKEALAKL